MKSIRLFLFSLVLWGGIQSIQAANAAKWCNPTTAPNISVKTSTDQINYDFSLSEKQLNKFNITTINPYGDNVITDVGGLMKGGIQTQEKMSFGTLINRATNEVCIWHDTLEVSIHIKPTIFVANEFPPGSCMHNSIMRHEQKHIAVDREIVNKYAALIGQAYQNDIARYRVFGPFPASNQESALNLIKTRMKSILTQYTNQMSAERKARQQEIDNINEYERVNKSCKK